MMGVPADIAQNAMLLHITGRNWLHIENYRKIIEFDAEKIVLLGKRDCLQITGQCLAIPYYSDEEMMVTGTIETVTYL